MYFLYQVDSIRLQIFKVQRFKQSSKIDFNVALFQQYFLNSGSAFISNIIHWIIMKESKWKPPKFNDNNEALYCNAFERYFAPSAPILLAE